MSLLVGSAIYLLTESKHKDDEHEKNNLSRIMALLLMKEAKKMVCENKNNLLMENYERLIKVIKKEKENLQEETKKNVITDDTLQLRERLANLKVWDEELAFVRISEI